MNNAMGYYYNINCKLRSSVDWTGLRSSNFRIHVCMNVYVCEYEALFTIHKACICANFIEQTETWLLRHTTICVCHPCVIL